ncbi:MAG: DMT family transporter [Candidatus Kerfeldbacteria bacterium]|nr:DMT family transporter [Candidatus Kerfeldbacteria bacterium]
MNSAGNHKTFGALSVLTSAVLFGSYGVWSRLIGTGMGNFFQGWTRALIILIVIVPIICWRKEWSRIEAQDRKWIAVFMLCTSLTQAPLFYAFNHMDVGAASILFFVAMFFTMNLVGIIFFRERLSVLKIIAALLALVGMCMIFSFSLAQFSLLAVCMALLNGIASGGEIAFSKRISSNYSPLFLTALSWFIILITNSLISFLLDETQIAFTFSSVWLWQLFYSLVSLFAFWFVIVGFKYVDATIGALIGLLEIVFSVILAWILFYEQPTVSIVVGGMLIIFAAALPHLQSLQNFRKV